jgi:hypothetical protein
MNEIDRFLNTDQENEISVQIQEAQLGTIRNDDQVVHAPNDASKEHSLDDTQETLPGDDNGVWEAAENAHKNSTR